MSSNHNSDAVIHVSEKEHKTNAVIQWCLRYWQALLAEFLSTAFLVLFGCMSCIPVQGSTESSLYSDLGFGLIVMINVQIFGHISGAHMNPAVTLGSVIWGSTSVVTGIAYIIAQCLGAIIAYGILIELALDSLSHHGVCVTLPHQKLNEFQAVGVEFGLTSVLLFMCCALWDPVNKDMKEAVSMKFGLAVVGLGIIGGPLTGASMNPARTLGPAFWHGIWVSQWVYWVGPLLGALISTTLYKVIWLRRKGLLK